MSATKPFRQTIFPSPSYRDPAAAMRFLIDAFGFTEENVHTGDDGTLSYVELSYDGNMLGFGQSGTGNPIFDIRPFCVYVAVDDVDAHYARAVAAGARIVMELTDQAYGSRDYAALDHEDNVWAFGTYRPVSSH